MNQLQLQQNLHAFWPGTVVRVSHGLYDHVALLGDRLINGERSVLSFSSKAQGFLEEPYSTFAQGRSVSIDGYPSMLQPSVVMQRARMRLGQRYSVTDFNCEHFVRDAHGLPPVSPQLAAWAFAGVLFCFAAAFAMRS